MRNQDRAISAQRYLRRRSEYWDNALKYVGGGKFAKASEFLWGAIAQSIKAVAIMRDIKITRHSAFFDFMRDLSKELNDKDLYKSFVFLNTLHRNFYDERIGPAESQIYLEEAGRFLRKIEEIGKQIELQISR
jgi:Archaeal PaREP1/PaREP8 family.